MGDEPKKLDPPNSEDPCGKSEVESGTNRIHLKRHATESKLVRGRNRGLTFAEGQNPDHKKYKAPVLGTQDTVDANFLLNTKQKESLSSDYPAKLRSGTNVSLDQLLTSTGGEEFKSVLREERKRQQIIAEMLKTERTYLEFMQTVHILFILPCRKSMQKTMEDKVPLLTSAQMRTVFQNLEDICAVNGELLKEMANRKRRSTLHWADLLIDAFSQETWIKSYQTYINGYTQARLFVSEAMKPLPQNPTPQQEQLAEFASFVKLQLSNDLCRGFGSLTSFLITPIQRLPRYLLYLRDLHSCTPESHVDHADVVQAYQILSKMTEQIDQTKLQYDEIYRMQALFQQFVSSDRHSIPEIRDPQTKILCEAPLLESVHRKANKETVKVLRYVILFSDLIICASKDDDEKLRLEWKLDLYCSSIVRKEGPGNPPEISFVFKERRNTCGYPLMTENVYELFPFTDGPFSSSFWSRHLLPFIEGPRALSDLTRTGLHRKISIQGKGSLLSPEDWKVLETAGGTHTYDKGDIVQQEGSEIKGFGFIDKGKCCVIKKILHKDVLLAVMEQNELFGEMSFLSDSRELTATCSIVAERDGCKVSVIMFDRVKSLLLEDSALARRFYQNLCLVIAGRYLNIVFQESREMEERVTASNYECCIRYGAEFSDESKTLLAKLGAAPSSAQLELPCKMKGKIGKGHLFISRHFLCYFSKASGLFGHLGRTVIHMNQIQSFGIQSKTKILSLRYSDPAKKSGHLQAHFTFSKQSHLTEAQLVIANLVNRKGKSIPQESALLTLSKEDWASLTQNQRNITFMAGETVVKRGAYNDGLYQVVKGKCKVEYNIHGRVLQFPITTGEIFGEVEFALGTVTGYSLLSDSPQAVVRVISYDHLSTIMEKKPEIAAKLYLLVAKTLRTRFLRIQDNLLLHKFSGTSLSFDKKKNSDSVSTFRTKRTPSRDRATSAELTDPTPPPTLSLHLSKDEFSIPRKKKKRSKSRTGSVTPR